jgi:hypothetical protein
MRTNLFLFLLLLAGCSEDAKTTFCQPVTQSTVKGGITVSQTYTYEGGKLKMLVSTNGTSVSQTSFEYTPEGDLGKSTKTIDGEAFVTTYAHDDRHFLVGSLFGHEGDTIESSYVYNNVGQLTRQDKRTHDTSGESLERIHYFYPDLVTHNPSTIATVTSADSVVVDYGYDDKINPDRELILPTIQAYNNVTSVIALAYAYTISYQYNGNGYPTSSTASNGITKTWTYSCSEF